LNKFALHAGFPESLGRRYMRTGLTLVTGGEELVTFNLVP